MRSTPALPAGVAAPQVILASQPPSLADIQMVRKLSILSGKTIKCILFLWKNVGFFDNELDCHLVCQNASVEITSPK